MFCVLGPGAVATVYICALPLPWRSPASTIGCPVFSLLFGLSNLDCSLKNSVVPCRPLRGFSYVCYVLSLMVGFAFLFPDRFFFSFMLCIFIIAH